MPSSPLRLAPVTLGCLLLFSGACTKNTTPPGPVVGSPDAETLYGEMRERVLRSG